MLGVLQVAVDDAATRTEDEQHVLVLEQRGGHSQVRHAHERTVPQEIGDDRSSERRPGDGERARRFQEPDNMRQT